MSSRNRSEQDNPTPSSDHVSAEAAGDRTEAEVVDAAKADAEQAANQAPPGATGNPAIDDDVPEEVDDGKLLHFQRVSDGVVQSVNPGSHAHRHILASDDWEKVSRAVARKFHARTFVSSARRAAQQERAKEQAKKALA